MINTKASSLLWDFCIVTEYKIMSSFSRGVQRSVLEVLTGDSVDISKYTDFKLYDLPWYWKTSHKFRIRVPDTVG